MQHLNLPQLITKVSSLSSDNPLSSQQSLAELLHQRLIPLQHSPHPPLQHRLLPPPDFQSLPRLTASLLPWWGPATEQPCADRTRPTALRRLIATVEMLLARSFPCKRHDIKQRGTSSNKASAILCRQFPKSQAVDPNSNMLLLTERPPPDPISSVALPTQETDSCATQTINNGETTR